MRHIILHGHIFKNAGSTFDWSLARNFGDAFLDHREDKAMRERRGPHLESLVTANPKLRALSSHHLCYPRPEMDAVSFHPVYLLRHPIERIASVYAFERLQDSDSRGARAAKEKSFQEYVTWRLRDDVPRTIRDYQACNVAGYHDLRPKESVPVDWLRRAANHLAAIDCVGVVDRYDESMLVFEAHLGTHFPGIDLSYVRQNTTRREGEGASLAERVQRTLGDLGELAEAVLAVNSYDMALYRQANQRLDDALARISDFDQRLTDFQRRCAGHRTGLLRRFSR